MTFCVAAPGNALSPVRAASWNGSIRAGDDLKIAFTLLQDDCETPSYVGAANARMTLYAEEHHRHRWDYGFSYREPCLPAVTVAGVVFDPDNGRINFMVPAEQSVALRHDRYRVLIEVDQPDGVSSEIEGLLQVRQTGRNTLGNAARTYMRIGSGVIGSDLIPGTVINNAPADIDGFPVPYVDRASSGVSHSAVLGRAVLGWMVLGVSS